MGFFDFFRGRPGQPSDPPLQLSFEERDYPSETETGDELDGRGYGLRDENDRALAWDDRLLAANGIKVVEVAGTSRRLDAIQGDAFAPGAALRLKPDPRSEYDKNAIGVWDATGHVQAGFVPKDQAAPLGRRLKREELEAFVLWEWRDSRGLRCGLRMLVAPPAALAERPKRLRAR